MKLFSYRYFSFKLTCIIIITCFFPLAGQVLSLKSGSVVEKGILRGEFQEIQLIEPRGTLQWQRSENGISWIDWTGKKNSSLVVLVNTSMFLRCAIQEASCETVYSDVLKLMPYELPVVSTDPVTEIQSASAICGGEIVSDGGVPIRQKGVCWSVNPDPTTADNKTTDGEGTGKYTSVLTGLIPGTTYYARAYAINEAGTAYGNQVSFTSYIEIILPSVILETIHSITRTSAAGNGRVTHDGYAPVTARGICWSLSQNPTIDANITQDGTGTGPFTSVLNSLTGNTVYYVRAYSTNSSGTSYSNEVSFVTSPVPPSVITSEKTAIAQTHALSGGTVISDGGSAITARGVCWSAASGPTIADSKTSDGTGTGMYISNLTGLAGNTTYHVRAYATNGEGTSYGNEIIFNTSSVLSLVTTAAVSDISPTTASSGGTVLSDGGSPITARGVCWSVSGNPTVAGSKTTDGTGTGSFISNLTGLTGNTIYYIRAYSTSSAGTSYGNEISFLTSHLPPTVNTSAVTDITQTTAVCGGNVISDGGSYISVRGVCWSVNPNPSTNNSKTSDGSGPGSFVSNLTGLTGNTIYYLRAYATSREGTSYGNEVTFITSPVLPVVTSSIVTDISQTTAISGGTASNDGGAPIFARGVCWSVTSTPTISDSKTADGQGTGTYISNLTGMTGNTVYFARAYATNSVGTSYGNEISFKTSPVLPTVTTSAATAITQTSAATGGLVISDGGADVTARGICWSTSHNPVIAGNKTTDGSGSGSFTSILTSLTGNTTYYARAYATNAVGTSYGNEVTFKTSPVLPAITTTEISGVTQTTAISGGTAVNDGGAAITARGICWSMSPDPTVSDSISSDGTGIGSFISNLSGLTGNTVYYARTYATNSVGTSYGNEISFKTSPVLPTVTTSDVSEITQTTAASGGSVINDGGAGVTARGVCWAVTPNPTTEGSKTIDGTGTGAFSSNLTNLTGNTVYYLRAYATNNVGTSYGAEIVCKTSPLPPTILTAPVKANTQNSASCGGNVISDGGADVTARGICWSVVSDPTLADSITTDGAGLGMFTSSLTGLSGYTNYFVRAYATNGAGTSYGEQESFTTRIALDCEGTLTDVRDGQKYCYKKIGEQTWMIENLAFLPAVSPPAIGSETSPYYYVNNYQGESVNEAKALPDYATYGVYYNWEAAKTACPADWHLPTDADWKALEVSQGMSPEESPAGCNWHTTGSIGSKLKASSAWEGNAGNNSGFTALPAGYWATGGFSGPGKLAAFWTATGILTSDNNSGPWYRGMNNEIAEGVLRCFGTASSGFSVRCVKNGVATVSSTQITGITQTTASSGGDATLDGGSLITARGICWSTSPKPTVADNTTTDGTGTGSYTSLLTGLTGNTTYYVRAYATNSYGTGYGSEVSFKTSPVLPTISTDPVSGISETTASSGGNVTDDGGGSISGKGVCWSTSQNPVITDSKTSEGTGTGLFSSNLLNLSEITTYYVRAYATNVAGTAYGEEMSFTTRSFLSCDGSFKDSRTDQEYCYKTIGSQTWMIENLAFLPSVSPPSDGSDGNPHYYVYGYGGTVAEEARAKPDYTTYGVLYNWEAALNACPPGWHLPSDNDWKNLEMHLGMTESEVNTAEWHYTGSVGKKLKSSSGWLNNINGDNSSGFTALPAGYRSSEGFNSIRSSAVFWTATAAEQPNAWYRGLSSDGGEGKLRANNPRNSGFAVRCIKNGLPAVTTAGISGISKTTATSGGNYIGHGGADITARGVCWSTQPNPTIVKNKTDEGTGTGDFVSVLTGLTGNTTYYVRAYCTNSFGTSYGNERSFITSALLPTLTTTAASDITQTSATTGGNITSDGGGSITDRGICWSTTQNPTIESNKTSYGTGSGLFIASLTALTGNTHYYVRAYCTNIAGTSYGNEISFKTSPVLPSVTTTAVSAITQTTAVSGNQVSSDGGSPVIARGVCWSTSQNPDVTGNKTNDGGGTGSIASTLTGLTGNTTYYLRAYATNSLGTSYGNELTFKTSPVLANISTIPVTDITQTTATTGGNITGNGGADITERGICWSTRQNPTTADNKTAQGTGTGLFQVTLTNLTGNTTYFVRAYSTNSAGTSYGNQISFKTSPVPPVILSKAVTANTQATASSGGNVTSDGGAAVTARGVCWSTQSNPTIAGSKTTDGTGTGIFTSSLTNLSAYTTYFLRAYATNSSGTSYGDEESFTTLAVLTCEGTFTDPRDGQQYCYKKIGQQTWMIENLAYLPSVNPPAAGSETSPYYYVYRYNGNSIDEAKALPDFATYGVYYNWEAARTACPPGWHLPVDEDWKALEYFLGMSPTENPEECNWHYTGNVGKKMKATTGWAGSPDNSSGFTALPAGLWTPGGFNNSGSLAVFWTGTSHLFPDNNSNSWYRGLNNDEPDGELRCYGERSSGFSVRCLKSGVATVSSLKITGITQTEAASGGNVNRDGGSPVTARGVCWSTSAKPTVAGSKTTDGTGIGSFTSRLTGLTGNTTYYVRAYSTNSYGTSYGAEVSFKTSPVLSAITTTAVTEILQTSATTGGNIPNDGGAPVTARGVCWSASSNPTLADRSTSDGTGSGEFSSRLTGLTGNTTYYVRAYSTNSVGTSYGDQISFKTSPVLPVLITIPATNITQISAASGGTITGDGGSAISERGVCWSATPDPDISDNRSADGTNIGEYQSNLTGLTGNTTYYARAYATNSAGTSYGNEISFKTKPVLSTISTLAISDITQTTASSGGNITGDGGAAITARGVCWSIAPNPTVAGSKTVDGNGTGEFRSSLTGLTGNTTYFARAYSTNSAGTSYGNEITFKTAAVVPQLTTQGVSAVAQTTATSGGNITSDGGAAISARGVCWSTSSGPTTAGNKTSDGTGTGSFTSHLSGLTGSTTYYVRAYATNSAGTSYGNEISFRTGSLLAQLSTLAVSAVAQTTATSGGNITSDGGDAISARGVCWSTASGPTTAGNKTSDGTGTGSFTSHLSGLTGSTTYYIRAYATNGAGTSYGNEVSFITAALLPAVTTAAASGITQTAANSGGTITSSGGVDITARGICWSTSSNPTTNDHKTSDGSGAGTFSSHLSGLVGNTTYFVRAYAGTSMGTIYGNEVSFKTLQLLPTITTTAVTNITETTATSGGVILSDGGAPITVRGICWSNETSEPTTDHPKTINGNSTGSFTGNLTSLTAGTTYFVRAYATNSMGTSYGGYVRFTTGVVHPTIRLDAITNITQSTASASVNITSDGGSAITSRGVCWSHTTSYPTTDHPHTTNGSGSGSFTAHLTGLLGNMTYYARAYAINSKGISYTPAVSFKTGGTIGRIKVSPNGHYLVLEDGSPFFWLGDTGWELFHRLTIDEAAHYFDNRVRKGFNLIQAVALAERDGLTKPNRNGDLPLINMDPAQPNDRYFQFVDQVVQLALSKGLYVGMLPTWGDKVTLLWGTGPVVFNTDNAYKYGLWMGRRYDKFPNIVWILGGDRPAMQNGGDWRPIWRAMARGIMDGTQNKALITYHSIAEETSSSQYFHSDSWLAFNMIQSGHSTFDVPTWTWVNRDWKITPAKPVLDAEPNYEDHLVNWDVSKGYFRDYDVRKQSYRSVFAGGCGVTYGNHGVWQFWSPREVNIFNAQHYWTEAIDRPGAAQMGYLKKLMESRPQLTRIPDQTIIRTGQGENGHYMCSTRDNIASYMMVYLPVGKKITVNTGLIQSANLFAWWLNPRTKEIHVVGLVPNTSVVEFTSPTFGTGNDWVLIIDNPAYNYNIPKMD